MLGKRPSKVEVYNDLNRKMVSLFRVLADKNKTSELVKRLELTPYSRELFHLARTQIDSEQDEIELARLMIVIQRQSHGGFGKQWSYCIDAPAAGYSASVRKFHAGVERLKNISYRLRRVQTENLPWEDILSRYDREGTLFYLDPPYVPETRISGGYEFEMTLPDHARMVDMLLGLKGMCVLSGYAHEVYLPLESAGWKRIEIDVSARSSQSRTRRTECLWVSPSSVKGPFPRVAPTGDLTNRQAAAYRVHELRTSDSEQRIREAVSVLRRTGNKITKAEVARITGISRVQISRRYSHLFDEK